MGAKMTCQPLRPMGTRQRPVLHCPHPIETQQRIVLPIRKRGSK
ncbi:uncharacterized protein G2W53_042218 [Senna tora]|uniref:Uncharacterized protein n=1 Tax=Senna tora TaxID=362788 RepID=A0A834VZC1_9FABA|nr:uncharacterized protein G2W53_042218 [Senna tora]